MLVELSSIFQVPATRFGGQLHVTNSITAVAAEHLAFACRYHNAEHVFRHESKFDNDEELPSLNHQLDADNGLQDLLFSYAAENNPQHYVDEFDSLVDWVDSSLDLYKVQQPNTAAAAAITAATATGPDYGFPLVQKLQQPQPCTQCHFNTCYAADNTYALDV